MKIIMALLPHRFIERNVKVIYINAVRIIPYLFYDRSIEVMFWLIHNEIEISYTHFCIRIINMIIFITYLKLK